MLGTRNDLTREGLCGRGAGSNPSVLVLGRFLRITEDAALKVRLHQKAGSGRRERGSSRGTAPPEEKKKRKRKK